MVNALHRQDNFDIVKINALPYTTSVAQTYHHGDLRDQLLNAGEAALAEMPIEKVTLREIARRAGVSHAAPQHHFPSLGHLLAEIAARGCTRLVTAMQDAATTSEDQSSAARMLAQCKAYLRFAENHMSDYQLMFGQRNAMAVTPNLLNAAFAAWEQVQKSARELVPAPQAEASALHIWSCLHGLAALQQAGRVPPDLPLRQMQDHVLNLLMSTLQND